MPSLDRGLFLVGSGEPDCSGAPCLQVRRGVSLLVILASLLIVALATVAIASTLVALRASNERDRWKGDYGAAARVIDQYILTVSTNGKLKGMSMEPLRTDLYQPAFDYYQQYVTSHANKRPATKLEAISAWIRADNQVTPQLADAHFHLAGLLAKRGSKDAVKELNDGLQQISFMKLDHSDPSTFPSLQQSALKYTLPTEWFTFRGESGAGAGDRLLLLVLGFNNAAAVFEELKAEHPESVSFRDDIAAVSRIPGTMFGFANQNRQALSNWQKAADNLESIVRDRPGDVEYKVRLAEALAAVASRQKSMGKTEEAMPTYQRVIELREQIVAASPEDKTRQQELTTAKRDLERIKTAKPAKKESPPEEAAASVTPEPAAAPDAAAGP
jgi:tetratricopeptide (TPR) repeat protein